MEEMTNIRILRRNSPWKKLPISEFWVRILHGRNYQYQNFGDRILHGRNYQYQYFGLEFSVEEITNIRILG
jgi:hypothetical protein